MARIRTIKPEFWTDGAVVGLSPYARLFFIGTWNFTTCDQGHLPDDPIRLKLQILPMDDVDPKALIEELITSGRLVRIHGEDGRSYLHIRRFTDHQKVEKRWSPRCAACKTVPLDESPETSPNHDEPLPNSPDPAEPPRTSPREGKGGEGKGKEEKTPSSPGRKRPATRLPHDWTPTEKHQEYASRFGLTLDREVFKFRNHAEANDRRQANWNAAFSQWLANAAEWSRPKQQPSGPQVPFGRISEQ